MSPTSYPSSHVSSLSTGSGRHSDTAHEIRLIGCCVLLKVVPKNVPRCSSSQMLSVDWHCSKRCIYYFALLALQSCLRPRVKLIHCCFNCVHIGGTCILHPLLFKTNVAGKPIPPCQTIPRVWFGIPKS